MTSLVLNNWNWAQYFSFEKRVSYLDLYGNTEVILEKSGTSLLPEPVKKISQVMTKPVLHHFQAGKTKITNVVQDDTSPTKLKCAFRLSVDSKGPDQTAQMGSLTWAFAIQKQHNWII